MPMLQPHIAGADDELHEKPVGYTPASNASRVRRE
jgi:hypothetical protein